MFVWEVIPLHFCKANFCKAKLFAKIARKNWHKSITVELMKATKKGGLAGKKQLKQLFIKDSHKILKPNI